KFLSVDPLTKSYPMLTPYQFASNRPIDGIDLDGLEFYKKETFLGFNIAFKKVDENSFEIVYITVSLDKQAMDRSPIVNQLNYNKRNSDLGLGNLRKGNGAIKTITAKGDGVFYSSATSTLGKVLSTTSKVTAFGAMANELVSGHEKINQKAAVINTARIGGMIEYDKQSLSWFMDVADNFIKSEEFKSLNFSSPEEFVEFLNFAFDWQKPKINFMEYGGAFKYKEKIEKFEGYFEVMKQFYENDQEKGWGELDLGNGKKQKHDKRKMETQPSEIRK
ncbi:MAG: hypothetical protein OEW75_11410, partial [Cyclobacteriaceae bacterium]|nr:hypothetical protein [Cyclobacteriaceae bacterium]